jgi:dienelactone hydrolase
MPAYPAFFSVLPNCTPDDKRLGNVRHLNLHYEFPGYATREAWEARAREIRQHILVTCGLYPMPEKTPLNPKVFDRMERDGFSVEKACFESSPGFLVTGNLYRPLGKKGPFPGVLSAHGHWREGRFGHDDNGSVPGRAIGLAREGYVCFSYDMVGYNDSLQYKHGGIGLQHELWGISLMGLQLWNSLRAVDFLLSLPDVDPERIGCTGASGGGTQTFMVTAIDDRITVSAPVCMVSATMQGGCLCENAPGLRQAIMNTEIAAVAAPRPLLLVSATGDWTKQTPEEEYPDVRSIYKLYGAEDRVKNAHFDAGHNYNQDSREAVYTFFRRWLLGAKNVRKVKEKPFVSDPKEALLLFPDQKLPNGMSDAEGVTTSLIAARKAQLDALWPKDKKGLQKAQKALRPALEHAINVRQPEQADVQSQSRGVVEGKGFKMEKLLIGRKSVGDQIPALLFSNENPKPKAPGVVLVHTCGKQALMDAEQGVPGAAVQALIGKKMSVLAIDAFLTGEYLRPGGQVGRNFAGITHWTTYNRTDHAERIQDVLTAVAFLKSRPEVSDVHLVGVDKAGVWSLFARALADGVSRTAIDADRTNATYDATWLADLYIPGLRCAGDVSTAGLLIAPAPLMIMNTGKHFDTSKVAEAYKAAGESRFLRLREEIVGPDGVANYLLSNQ